MRTTLLLCLGLGLGASLAGCVIGAPPGFSSGDSWTMPLVDPLSDGRMVTPVMVDGKGPFLFAIDPDARFTTADQSLAAIIGIPAKGGQRISDEHDTTHPTWYVQLPNLKVGTLDISLITIGLVENGKFDADGRRIWGVIGRDVIADSLVFTMDRDHGIARLTVNSKYVPPAGAQVIEYEKLVSRSQAPALPGGGGVSEGLLATTRYLVHADVDGKKVELHLDLGDVPSQLRPQEWAAAQLQPSDWPMTLIDEAGTHRDLTQDATAANVTVQTEVAPLSRSGLGFVAYDDRRWLSEQLDGTLGLDFFRPYVVSADWDHEKFYLSPRDASPATTAARIGRWNAATTSQCKVLGCASATATLPQPPPSPEMGMADGAAPGQTAAAEGQGKATFHVDRDPALAGQALEVILSATSATGTPLPDIYVDLGPNTNAFEAPVEPRFAGAQFVVSDISPFPRACPNRAPSCAHLAPPLAP